MWLSIINMRFQYWDGNTVTTVTLERSEHKLNDKFNYQCVIYDASYRIARETISIMPEERPIDLVCRVFDILAQRYL